jgi:hypothetical protein
LPAAQVWLLLNRLLVDPAWRGKCRVDSESRKDRLLKVRERIDNLLVDQLPFLKGLLFLLEQLALGCTDGLRSGGRRPSVGIHQVCYIARMTFRQIKVNKYIG